MLGVDYLVIQEVLRAAGSCDVAACLVEQAKISKELAKIFETRYEEWQIKYLILQLSEVDRLDCLLR
jgi:hypothetical protein